MNEVVCSHIIHIWDQNGQEVRIVILGVDVFLHPFVPVFPITWSVRTHGKLKLPVEKSGIAIILKLFFFAKMFPTPWVNDKKCHETNTALFS